MHAQLTALQNAVQKQPNDPAVHYNLANYYLSQAEYSLAMRALEKALALAPKHPQILMLMGNAASGLNNEQQAQQFFLASLAQQPNQADVHFNLANSLRKLTDLTGALTHYQRAISLNAHDADYFNNLGNTLRELGHLPEAIDAYEQALKLQPDLIFALVHWIHQKQHIADWQGLETAIEKVRTFLNTVQTQKIPIKIPPFACLAMPSTSPQQQTTCASVWAEAHYEQISALPPCYKHENKRIRVAYLSSDFRVHPLAYLITDVLQAHDRSQFELYIYSQAPNEPSPEQQAIRITSDYWIEIQHLSDEQVARHMREQAIDILVDLTGYTQNSRSGIVAYRPSYKSINWLGYAGSMGYLHGKPLFDYIIVDNWVNVAHLAELAISLPCYQPNNAQRPIGETGTRASHGLPEEAFVFCCFNQSFKITPTIFNSWLNILNRVPNSVLWLLDCNPWAKQNLRAYAKQHKLDTQRLIFAPRVNIAEHLARHSYADLCLDTLPYNAHTTASDALWMNVPVVTCVGDTFASRVTASLLSQCELNALIVNNMSAYETLACDLASHQEHLQEISNTLKQNKHKLFNPTDFVLQLEQAYRDILKD